MSTPRRVDAPPAALIVTTSEQLAAIVREVIEAALGEREPADGDTLIDSAECARRIGVSLPTLRKMSVPHVMAGDHRRYHWPTVLEHLLAHRAEGGDAA
jgi:hypothetical protein